MPSLRAKLTAALLLTGAVAVALVGLIAHWRLNQKFSDAVLRDSFNEYRKDVAAYITTYGSWEQAEASEPFTHFVVRRHELLGRKKGAGLRWAPPPHPPAAPAEDEMRVPPLGRPGEPELEVPPERLPPFRFVLLDPQGKVLRGHPSHPKGSFAPADVQKAAFPIHAQGRLVALAVPMGRPMLSALDLGYLQAVREALVYGGIVAVLLATLLGIALGTGLMRPLRRLTGAVGALTEGNLGLQVPVTSRDETGALALAFNRMSLALAQSRQALEQSHAGLREQTRQAEEARHAAEQANLAKSRFLAAASHDLRQPLHALGLFVSTLRGERTGPRADEALESIEASLESLRALFDELLDISRLDAGVIQPRVRSFALQRLFDLLAREYAPLAARKGLRLSLVSTALAVESDPALLERMLRNLVSNAIRYTARGGVVMGCRRQGACVRIEVWDSGIGIPPEEQERIFGEFYQVRAADGGQTGLGLGLAIVDRLSRLLRHSVRVTSTPGKGSRFSITLPRAQAPGGPAPAPPEAAVPRGLKDAVVLVLDDQPAIRRGMEALLAGWGCRPVSARNAAEALERLRALGAAPDFIVADYHLGDGATGPDALARIQAAFARRVPALILTGDTGPESLRAAQASGHVLLHKPVNPARLRAVLARVLR